MMLYIIIDNVTINLKKEIFIINKSFTTFIIQFLTSLKLSIPLFYKYSIYIIVIILITIELYQNNYVAKKMFYLLLLLFVYKQIYNLCYFSWYHNINFDKTLALYYYKLNILAKKNSQYTHKLKMFYMVSATYEKMRNYFIT